MNNKNVFKYLPYVSIGSDFNDTPAKEENRRHDAPL